MEIYMEEIEILGRYRRADNKRQMVQILAELNGVERKVMEDYLIEHGVPDTEILTKGRLKEKMEKSVKPIAVAERKELPDSVRALVDKRINELGEIANAYYEQLNKVEKELDDLCKFLSNFEEEEKEAS